MGINLISLMAKRFYDRFGNYQGQFLTEGEHRARQAHDSMLDNKLYNVFEFFAWWFFLGWIEIECNPLDNEAVTADYIGFAAVILFSVLFRGAFFIFLICWYLAKWAGVPLLSDGMDSTTIEWVCSVAFLVLSIVASRMARRYL